MGRGRKPIPAHLKLITAKGSGSGRLNVNENETKGIAGFPEASITMSERAQAQWPRVVETLNNMGVLAISDWMAVEMLCEARADWMEARDNIEENGITFTSMAGLIKPNPAVAMRGDAARRITSLLAEFGMTPSSRTKVPQVEKPKDDQDPGAQYFD